MAAPAFVQAGAGALWQSGGAVSVSMSGVTVGNFVIAQALVDGADDAVTVNVSSSSIDDLASTGGGLTSVTAGPGDASVGSPAAGGQHIYVGRALTTTSTILISSAGADVYARLYEFSGVNAGTTLADVIENSTAGAYAKAAGSSATVADVGVTTLGADRLALNFIAVNDDNQAELTSMTGETGGDWTYPVAAYGSATGTDGAIGLVTATMAAAGTIDGGTDTITSDGWGVVGFALIPAVTASSLYPGSSNRPTATLYNL